MHCEIGGQRPAKFSQYLPDSGWNTVVVTRFWDDASRNGPWIIPRKMPDVNAWHPRDSVENACGQQRSVIEVPFRLTTIKKSQLAIGQERAAWRIVYRKWLALRQMLTFNSTGTDWLNQAYRAVVSLKEITDIDCIYATSPPPDTLILASKLSAQLGIPWVADLRDRSCEQFPANAFLARNLRKMKYTIKTASAVVVVSEALADHEKLELSLNQRPYVVPNGFDRSEMEGTTSDWSNSFQISYTGSVYLDRQDPGTFMRGLNEFANNNPEVASFENRVFQYFGTSEGAVMESAQKHGVEHLTAIRGHVTRDIALKAQSESTALLHLTDCRGVAGIATGKIYEYFAAGRPIVAVPGDRDTVEHLISSTRTGVIARTYQEVARVLQSLYNEWRTNQRVAYSPIVDEVAKYSRQAQSQYLASILTNVANGVAKQKNG